LTADNSVFQYSNANDMRVTQDLNSFGEIIAHAQCSVDEKNYLLLKSAFCIILILVKIKLKYLIQKFHDICLSYYFKTEQKSSINYQCTNLKVGMDQVVSEVNSSLQT
jgi:hypothetical protein